jgi:hypothetical protein
MEDLRDPQVPKSIESDLGRSGMVWVGLAGSGVETVHNVGPAAPPCPRTPIPLEPVTSHLGLAECSHAQTPVGVGGSIVRI